MAILLYACQKADVESLELVSFFIGNQSQDITKSSFSEVPVDLAFELVFSSAIDPSSASGAISLKKNQSAVSILIQSNNKNILVKPDKTLDFNSPYV